MKKLYCGSVSVANSERFPILVTTLKYGLEKHTGSGATDTYGLFVISAESVGQEENEMMLELVLGPVVLSHLAVGGEV